MEQLSENNVPDLSRINQLDRKVKELALKYRQLQEDYASALVEIQKIEGERNILRQELNDFQNRFKISKIVTSIADEQPEHTQLKNKINEYIREIDKCIAHLSE